MEYSVVARQTGKLGSLKRKVEKEKKRLDTDSV